MRQSAAPARTGASRLSKAGVAPTAGIHYLLIGGTMREFSFGSTHRVQAKASTEERASGAWVSGRLSSPTS